MGVTEILCNFKLVLEGKTGREIPESSRLEFIEKFSANNFALSDAEDNTSGLLNRGGIADLPLLRTLNIVKFYWSHWIFPVKLQEHNSTGYSGKQDSIYIYLVLTF